MTKDWKALTPYEGIRHRTEMYFGSRDPHEQLVLDYNNDLSIVEYKWTPAAFTAIREIIDNAVDEVVAHGFGDTIKITYDSETMIFSVYDNGRGIPINYDEEHKDYAASVLLSHVHSGRNFNDDTRGETRGVNGIGAKGVNFSSEWFNIVIDRDEKSFELRFKEGEKEVIREDPIIFPSNNHSGTFISFKLSEKVFKAGILLPEQFIKSRVIELALCYPKLKIFYNENRIQIKSVDTFLFKDKKPIKFSIDAEGFKSNFWLLPSFMPDGAEFTHGLVNAIPVFNGGTHIDNFRKNFANNLLIALEKESKKRKLEPNKSDVSDGLLIFNITQMTAPSFDSQAKTRLINENVGNIVKKEMDDPNFFKKVIKENPEWIENIYEKCRLRTERKDEDEVKKLAKAAKKQKVEDLKDAVGINRSKCILFLAEGDSAISGMIQDRDAEIHGGLALSGKPKNIREVPIKEIMKTEVLVKIMNSIGLIPGERINRHTLRYGKVYITTDADEDGKNIAALLINFFYTLWPELFDPEKEPFIYIFDTPLIIAVKGNQRKYWYNDTYNDFNADEYKSWDVTRAKGLAALKREDWKYVLKNPKLFPITDDGELKEALDLLFNDTRSDDRKTLIGI